MLDCYVNAKLSALLQGQSLDEKLKHNLPLLDDQKRAELMQEAKSLLEQSTHGRADLVTAAEEVLLKTFCQYNLQAQELTSYDLIFELFNSPAFVSRKEYWQERYAEVYQSPPRRPWLWHDDQSQPLFFCAQSKSGAIIFGAGPGRISVSKKYPGCLQLKPRVG
jgi:hypothetical protein